jgi:hypothetical protein
MDMPDDIIYASIYLVVATIICLVWLHIEQRATGRLPGQYWDKRTKKWRNVGDK